uniref:Dead box ATP-dependent RNA helicase, putative n=1 Tax=Arundo donax TaxID=35708 RepID=A0A0A9HAM9_ARUDO
MSGLVINSLALSLIHKRSSLGVSPSYILTSISV